jgi:hypothetical protein
MEREYLVVLGGESCSSYRDPEGDSRAIIYQWMRYITDKKTLSKFPCVVPKLFKMGRWG